MAATATPYGFRPVRMVSGAVPTGTFNIEEFPIKYGYANVIGNGEPVVLSAPASQNATTIAGSGTTATVTLTAHGYVTGQTITVSGVTPAAFNGSWVITVTATNTFTYTYTGGAYVSGTAALSGNGGFLNTATDGTFNSLGDHYIGIFVGCHYTNPSNGQPQWDQYYPGTVNAYDTMGMVITDPNTVFQVQAHYPQFDALSRIGYSYRHFVPSPAYTLGTKDSAISLDAGIGSTATASTAPWKVVGVAPYGPTYQPNLVGGVNLQNATGYVDTLVKVNSGVHVYTIAL